MHVVVSTRGTIPPTQPHLGQYSLPGKKQPHPLCAVLEHSMVPSDPTFTVAPRPRCFRPKLTGAIRNKLQNQERHNPEQHQRNRSRFNKCSKSRNGRNPQRHGIEPNPLYECSKSRNGRNPQLHERGIGHLAECSKSRNGRNPQRGRHGLPHSRECSKSRNGRNPQRPRVARCRRSECSTSRNGRNPEQLGHSVLRVIECSKLTNSHNSQRLVQMCSCCVTLLFGLDRGVVSSSPLLPRGLRRSGRPAPRRTAG